MGEEIKQKKKNHFLTGVLSIFPTILFLIIIFWILGIILKRIGGIVSLFPDVMINKLGLPDSILYFLGFLILCGIIRCLGYIINMGSFGKKVKNVIDFITSRVPLLNTLSKITNQVAHTLQNTDSFKKVILTRFPMEKTWSVGFLTSEETGLFEESVNEKRLVSVFIPTTPNPTNGYLVLMNPKDFIETDVPVATAISFIISMGTAGAANEVLKKSYPSSK